MDYDSFLNDYKKFEPFDDWFVSNDGISGASGEDVLIFDNPVVDDRVDHPSHYTSGKTEVIDVIEDAIKDAPSNVDGMLQAQILKYILRMWLKDNPMEDAKKARWYLDRLIAKGDSPR